MTRTKWITRNADVGTIETLDELDDLGSDAPGAGGELLPSWAKYITRIAAAGALDGAAIGNGVLFGRLRGAIDNGDNEITFMISGGGVQVATGTQNGHNAWISPPLAVPVEGGGRMKFFAEIFGDAENDSEVSISVQVSDSPHPIGAKWTRSFTADVDGIDADTNLTGALGADATPVRKVPDEATRCTYVSVAHGYDQAADGTMAILLRLKSNPFEDDHDITCAAQGSITGQAGSDETAIVLPAVNIPMGIADEGCGIVGGGDLNGRVRGEQVGDDLGSGQIGVTLWLAP